jgi:Mycothiol maleylpyruvate isomerase N-terminal domain
MTDTGFLAIVDTDREELRGRIEDMRQRFYRLARSADPHARRPGLDWNVQQVVAHVLSVAQRYRSFAETSDFRRATDFRDLDQINQEELEAVMAPIPVLVEQLEALAPGMDAFFDSLTDDFSGEFHFGVQISGIVVQINWLFELVLHGDDVARSIGVPWEISERDMLFLLREAAEVVPAYVRPGLSMETDICVALQVPDARPYVIHVHDGIAEMRLRRADERPDAVLKAPASTLVKMLLHRIGPFTAVRQGLRLTGGRRPWKAMKLMSCFVET